MVIRAPLGFVLLLYLSRALGAPMCSNTTPRPPFHILKVSEEKGRLDFWAPKVNPSVPMADLVYVGRPSRADNSDMSTELTDHRARISRGSLVFVHQWPFALNALVSMEVLVSNSVYLPFHRWPSSFVSRGDKGHISSETLEGPRETDLFIMAGGQVVSPVVDSQGHYEGEFCPGAHGLYAYEDDSGGRHFLAKDSLWPLRRLPEKGFFLDALDDFQQAMDQVWGPRGYPFEFSDFGFIKLPMDQQFGHGDIQGRAAEGSFVHYQGVDMVGSDTWARPTTLCSVYALARKFKAHCLANFPGTVDAQCTLQIGDLAFPTPGRNQRNMDALSHKTHYQGTCVDLRPLRKDDQWTVTTIGHAAYSRELTKEFLRLAVVDYGGSIIFDDPRTFPLDQHGQPIRSTVSRGSHRNHIHLCFEGPTAKHSCVRLKDEAQSRHL